MIRMLITVLININLFCLAFAQDAIEGRWIPGGFGNTMYEFVDTEPFAEAGLRYTYYCPDGNGCDETYWNSLDTSDALPTINPYTVDDSTLSIDLHFGNTATYSIGFRCDGQVVDFYYDEDDFTEGLHSTMYRLGFDDVDNDCLEPDPDDCLCTEEWDPVCGIDGNTYSNSCFATCQFVVIAHEGECLVLNEEIEGRWHVVGWEHAIMYQFLDTEVFADAGLRYTIYVNEDGEFDDLDGDNTGGTPDPYSVEGDIVTIDYHFGNIVSYQMIYKCDGQVLDLYYIDYDIVAFTLFREFYDYNECLDTNPDNCMGLDEYECWYAEGCEWEESSNIPEGGSCVEIEAYNCSDMENQTECDEVGCEWVEDMEWGSCSNLNPYMNNGVSYCNDPSTNTDQCYTYTCYGGYYGQWNTCCGGSDYLIANNSYCEEVSFIPGDANGDNTLNVADIVLIVDFILNSEYDEYSDINQDGILNIIDIVELVNRILDN